MPDYLQHLRRLSRAEHTIQAYQRDLKQFFQYLACHAIDTMPDRHLIQHYVNAQSERNLSARSIARHLVSLRQFFEFLRKSEQVTHNPVQYVRAPKAQKKLPSTIDVDTLAHILNQPAHTWHQLRDKAIIELLYSSGLRLAELVGLNTTSIDWDQKLVQVMGKGSKPRIVPIGSAALRAVQAWLAERAAFARNEALFIGRSGRRLSPRSVHCRLRQWGIHSQSQQPLHPHLFRHCFASHLLESSGDLRGVQELLGHAHLSTTQIYTHLDFQHLADVYEKAHPKAHLKNHDDDGSATN